MSPVTEAGIVTAGALVAEPSFLEQRADHVAAVADDVQDSGPGVGENRCRQHEARLGGLLDRPQVADEREAPDALERRSELNGGLGGRKPPPALDGSLQRPHLAEVDESRLRPDRAGEEARPGTRRADDENRPLRREPRIAARLAPASLRDADRGPPVEARLPKDRQGRHGAEG